MQSEVGRGGRNKSNSLAGPPALVTGVDTAGWRCLSGRCILEPIKTLPNEEASKLSQRHPLTRTFSSQIMKETRQWASHFEEGEDLFSISLEGRAATNG